jgi:hypothetical protein
MQTICICVKAIFRKCRKIRWKIMIWKHYFGNLPKNYILFGSVFIIFYVGHIVKKLFSRQFFFFKYWSAISLTAYWIKKLLTEIKLYHSVNKFGHVSSSSSTSRHESRSKPSPETYWSSELQTLILLDPR